MHATGIEFDYALFVGVASETYALVVGIVLGSLDNFERRLERVSAIGEEAIGLVEIVVSVGGADDDGQAGGAFVLLLLWRFLLRGNTGRARQNHGAGQSCT